MTTETTSDQRARRAVLVGFTVQGLTFASFVTRLPTIKDDFDLSDYQVLGVLAAVTVAAALGSLLAGYAAERWTSATTLRWSLAGVSTCVVLPGLAGSTPVLVVTACAYGVFLGSVDAALNMQGVAVEKRYGRSIMTGFYAIWSGAAVVGAGYAAVTIELDVPLVLALLGVAVVGGVLNAVWSRHLLRADDAVPSASSTVTTAHRVPWLPIVLIGIPTTAMWLGDSATSVWSGIYLEDGLSASASVAPIAYGAYQLVLLIVRLVGDRLIGAHGAVRVIRASGLVATVGLVLVVAAPGIPVVIAGFALLGGGLALVPPLSYVAAAAVGGEVAVSRVNLANYLGYVLAAFGIAIVAETAGNREMFLVPLVTVLALPLMAARFAPRPAPDPDFVHRSAGRG